MDLHTAINISAAAKSRQSCPTLCNPVDGSPPGSPIPGILQARTLEWVAISFSSAWKWKVKSESEVAESCLTLSDPMDYSLPGSSIHGISQARVLAHVSPLCTKFLWQDRTLIENKIWYRSLEKPIAVSEPFVHAKISLAAPKFYFLSQKSTYLHRSKVTLGLGLLFYKFDFWKIH